jgi:Protein of unknown function (DUF629)
VSPIKQTFALCFAEEEEFLKVPLRDLQCFYSKHLDASRLRNMVADAVMFFKLQKTWAVCICPIPECLSWFTDDDSLILHLIYEHHNAWLLATLFGLYCFELE